MKVNIKYGQVEVSENAIKEKKKIFGPNPPPTLRLRDVFKVKTEKVKKKEESVVSKRSIRC